MARKKARLPELELQTTRGMARDHEIAATIRTAIQWAGVVFSAWLFARGLASLAGQTTEANILVKLLGDFRVSQGLAWIFGASGIGYGVLRDRQYRKKGKRLGDRIKELEESIDRGRSSSQPLDEQGDSQ